LVEGLQKFNCTDINYTFTQFDLESDEFNADQLPRYGADDLNELLEIFAKNPTDWSIRKDIAHILGDIGDPRGIPALVEMLYAEYPWDRPTGIRELLRINDPRAIQSLRDALPTVDKKTQQLIIEALANK
jgi:HEAT repeat protein